MLTPAQIRAHRFISAVRGTYKADDVDSYFEEVVTSYEQAFKENSDLIKKIGLLAERVEAYRNDEENIKSTLLTAQRTADNLIRESNQKSEEMLQAAEEKFEVAESEAKVQAQKILDEANQAIHDKLFDAEEKANKLIADASKEAQRLLDDSKRDAATELKRITEEIKSETLCLEILKKESASFKNDLLEKYRQHIDFIDAIPGVVASTIKPEAFVSFRTEDDSQTTASDSKDKESAEDAAEDNASDENDDENTEPGLKTDEQLYDADGESLSDELNSDQENPAESDDDDEEADDDEEEEADNDDDDDDDSDDEDESGKSFATESNQDTESKEVEDAIEENLTDSEKATDVFDLPESEQANGLNVSEISVGPDTNEVSSEGVNNGMPAANLFGLRQRAFAQQQESDETETSITTMESPDDTVQLPAQEETPQQDPDTHSGTVEDAPEETEDEGFKVYLENLDADDDSLSEDSSEPDENKGLFETVEYDDDDNDNDDGNASHPRFKGFFKK